MQRDDATIEDATFEVVDEGRQSPKQLHPQFALWLARGFICAVGAIGLLVMRPGLGAQSPADVRVADLAVAVTSGSAGAVTPEPAVLAASLSQASRGVVETAAVTTSIPMRPLAPMPRSVAKPDAEEDLVIEAMPAPKPRAGADMSSRVQSQGRRTVRQARTAPRPLTFIARGAKRTIRSVGVVVSRLF